MWMITWEWAQSKQICVINVNFHQRESIFMEDLFNKVDKTITQALTQRAHDQSGHSGSE